MRNTSEQTLVDLFYFSNQNRSQLILFPSFNRVLTHRYVYLFGHTVKWKFYALRMCTSDMSSLSHITFLTLILEIAIFFFDELYFNIHNWESHACTHCCIQWRGFDHRSCVVCLQSSEHASLSDMLKLCLLFVYAACLCTQTGRRTIYHWHDMVRWQTLTTRLSDGSLTCMKHLKPPELWVYWCTGHSHWDRSLLEI